MHRVHGTWCKQLVGWLIAVPRRYTNPHSQLPLVTAIGLHGNATTSNRYSYNKYAVSPPCASCKLLIQVSVVCLRVKTCPSDVASRFSLWPACRLRLLLDLMRMSVPSTSKKRYGHFWLNIADPVMVQTNRGPVYVWTVAKRCFVAARSDQW